MPAGSISPLQLSRRQVLAAGAATPFAALATQASAAAGFPARNIQFVIPYAAGGGFDSYVRFISPVVERYLPNRVSIVPINITAGSGSRGISQLYRSKPDGYTIGIFDVPGMFIQQAVQGNSAYDLSKFAWIGCMGEGERYLRSHRHSDGPLSLCSNHHEDDGFAERIDRDTEGC